MSENNKQLKQEGNAFYELDLTCVRNRQEQKKKNRKQTKSRQKPGR